MCAAVGATSIRIFLDLSPERLDFNPIVGGVVSCDASSEKGQFLGFRNEVRQTKATAEHIGHFHRKSLFVFITFVLKQKRT